MRGAQRADAGCVAVLRWLAASLLLVMLIVGVGTVMAYVLGGATLTGLAVGAALCVVAWHGLRGTGPRGDFESAREEWTLAIVAVVLYAAGLALVLWNPWFLIAFVVFPLWTRIRRRL